MIEHEPERTETTGHNLQQNGLMNDNAMSETCTGAQRRGGGGGDAMGGLLRGMVQQDGAQ